MTAKKTTTTKASEEKIIAAYMDMVLLNETEPKSVYKFCKQNNFTEEEFYAFYGSFEGLQKKIWDRFFHHSITLIEKSKDYDTLSNQDKMLTFFFTFFEVLTANRSYVLFTLKEQKDMMKQLSQLKGLRTRIKGFAAGLITEKNDEKQLKILKNSVTVFSEGAWIQTLFLMKYWMDDNSPKFEKTDIVIEKSVRAIFDVFDTTPLESVIDFGKFLWKERMA
ncbi:MAG: TetR family transcriptional regulator C-terminal domain-containing protein [Altibacter sp.]|nr:TetR family transcriptional regulator C-terminal domain-containing protein [Altibacter sp.]